MSNTGFLSSFTSLFNGTGGPSSNNGYQDRKRSAFGNGFPASMRNAPPNSLDDGGAWTLPYSYYKRPGSAATPNGQYPPARTPYESSATVNISDNVNESTSTLVPAQGRPSMTLASNVSFPSTAYPPLKHTWKRIRAWCDNNYSELADTLNWPATDAQLDDLELTLGFTLPPAVRDSYLCYDGQELESNNSCSDGLFFGMPLLSLDQIAEEWSFWRTVDEDPTSGASAEVKGWMSSCPSGWIRSEYSCRGWIPLISDHVGNYVGVDLSPNPNGGGSPGQVILFGRDFDTKIVLWRGEGEGGWGRFMQYVAEELEGGVMWTLEDNQSADSNDEEDTIGYNSYFSNGGAGASQGGGDRGGEGSVGFKLKGEYKGWPVLEAWADKSMRCWDDVGMSASQPAWQADMPSVHIGVEEDNDDLGESSSTVAAPKSPIGQSHPLEEGTNDSSVSSTLSPPLASNRGARSKQKRREDAAWPAGEGSSPGVSPVQERRRVPPPAPAAPLDLPTIDDVRAAHAAHMASQRKSGNYHYDAERGRPPPGMGGMGMGMGVASTAVSSRYTTRYAHRQPKTGGGGGGDVHVNMSGRDEDGGLELATRSSAEGRRNSSMSVEDIGNRSKSSSFESPRSSLSGQPARMNNGRTLYSAAGNPGTGDTTIENLIDAASSTDLNASTKSRATIEGNHGNEPYISSPLAKQSSVFSSMQDQADATNRTPAAAPSLVASS
jgi:cell wall assembly regulator SMI1